MFQGGECLSLGYLLRILWRFSRRNETTVRKYSVVMLQLMLECAESVFSQSCDVTAAMLEASFQKSEYISLIKRIFFVQTHWRSYNRWEANVSQGSPQQKMAQKILPCSLVIVNSKRNMMQLIFRYTSSTGI